MASNNVTLGYWNIRGRGGIIRELLHYCNVEYTNKTYTDAGEWFGKDKPALTTKFPNLPYLIDGDKTITESSAILSHVAIRSGKKELIGNTDDKFIQVQTALYVVGDLRSSLGQVCWTKGDFKTEKEAEFTNGTVKAKLETLNKALEGQEWITGFLSLADFELFEQLDLIHDLEASRLESYPNLISFRNRFLELPEIKAFRASDKHISLWFPPGMSAWTNA